MQDGQHGAIGRRIEKLVRVPGGRQRPCFRLAVANDAGDQQVRVVEGGAEGVEQAIAKLAAFVDRAGRLGCGVAGDAAWKGELFEQAPQPVGIAGNARVALGIGALEVGVGDHARAAMARATYVNRVQIAFGNGAIEMDVHKIQAWRGAPVSE